MGKVISVINLKGGVGKTTTTVALAEFLTSVYKKKVLVIDIDPQTNATVMLVNQDTWKEANDRGQTVYHMFLDKLEGSTRFHLSEAIIKKVSNITGGVEGLDLLPSSIDLITIQDQIPLINSISSFAQSPITVLSSYLTQDMMEYYDYILVDCPPNLGAITLNGIFISDYYLIPVIPDILSTYGIPQITDRVEKVVNDIKNMYRTYAIQPLGIVINKFRLQSRMHRETRDDLLRRSLLDKQDKSWVPYVFKEVVKETNRVSEATDVDAKVNSLKQKLGYDTDIYQSFERLTLEFLERLHRLG